MDQKVEFKVEPEVEAKREHKLEVKVEPAGKKQRRSADRNIAREGLKVLRKEAHESHSGTWCRWCARPHLVPAAVFLGKLSISKKREA